MFGFPSSSRYYSQDPWGGYRAPTSRRAPAAAPSRGYGSGYGDRYPTGGFSDLFEDPYQARARKLRQQQQLEQQRRAQEEARQQALAQQDKRRKLLQKYTDAAVTIQRAYRKHLEHKRVEQENSAAAVITRCIRAYPKMRHAKKIQGSLRRLAILRGRLGMAIKAYQASPFGYRHNLYFVDQVEKIIFQLDDIPHFRDDFVRAVRKQIVKEAQAGLAFADLIAKMLARKARKLATHVSHYLKNKNQEHVDSAARVVQRVVRAYPAVRDARRVRKALAELTRQQQELRAARAAYEAAVASAQAALNNSQQVLAAAPDHTLAACVEDVCSDLLSLSHPSPISLPLADDIDDEADDDGALAVDAAMDKMDLGVDDARTGDAMMEERPVSPIDELASAAASATAPAHKEKSKKKKKNKRRGRKHGKHPAVTSVSSSSSSPSATTVPRVGTSSD